MPRQAAKTRATGPKKAAPAAEVARLRHKIAALEAELRRTRTLDETSIDLASYVDTIEDTIIWSVQADRRRHIFLLGAVEEIYGRPAAAFLDGDVCWLDPIHPEDRASVEESFARWSGDGGWRREYRILRPDGELRWLIDRGWRVDDPGGGRFEGITQDVTDRRRAANALRQTERHLEEIAANIPGSVWRRILHADGTISFSYVSAGEARRYGISPDEVKKNPEYFLGRYGPVQRERWHRAVLESAASLQPFDFEAAYLDAEGKQRWDRNLARPRRQENGDVVWDGIAIDITAQKRAEQALRDSETRFRDFAEAASEWFWEVDENLRFRTVTHPPHTDCRPLPLQIVPGRLLWELPGTGHETDDAMRRHRADIEAHRPFRDFRYAITAADGQRRHLRINGKPLFDRSGDFLGYRGTGIDETAAVEARQRAENTERRLFAALDSISEGIALYDADDRLVAVNASYVDIFRLDPDLICPGSTFEEALRDAVARRPGSAAHGHDEAWIEDRLRRHRRAAGLARLDMPDGQILRIDESRTPDGGLIVVATDITEETRATRAVREAKEEAEQANRTKSRFLAAASHDLRQPLHAMNLLLDALDTAPDIARRRRIREDIGQAIQIMNDLLASLLDVSRLEAKVITHKVYDFPVAEIFRRIGTECGHRAKEKQLDFRVVVSDAVVRSDITLLQSIVRNFVANAVNYTDSGRVLLGCRRRDGRLRIEVWDTGRGIAPDQRRRIFEAFYQIGRPERKPHRGLGLGLAIASGLADLLEHPITVESVPGRGSVFAVEVPLGNRGDQAREAARISARVTGDIRGRSILVVEDDDVVLSAMAATLGGWGASVVSAHSGREALSWLAGAEAPPDLVIADYHLATSGTGMDVIDAVRRESGDDRLPGILLTGDTSVPKLIEHRGTTCPVLLKPVPPGRLRALIRHTLNRLAVDERSQI